jgi:hypothetical protein
VIDCLEALKPNRDYSSLEVERRARGTGQAVPLSTRYDPNDKTFSEPLPHLFARLVGPTQNVLSYHYVRKLLIGIPMQPSGTAVYP